MSYEKYIESVILFKFPIPCTECFSLPEYALDCIDVLLKNSSSKSGLYRIYPSGQSACAFCDMETDGGGWMVSHQTFIVAFSIVRFPMLFNLLFYAWK